MQKSVEAEKLQSRMKLGEYLPEVGVGVGAFTFDMDDDWNNNLMAFGTVRIPLTDWWEGSYALHERKLREQIAENNAAHTADLLKLQMDKAWFDMQETFQQISIAKEAVEQATANLKITTDFYNAGTIGISDLLEAQAILQQTRDNLTESQCNYKINVANYLKVTAKQN